jgi:hypothetical protein
MNTKTYKVKSLYTQNDGTFTVGAPDYFVDTAIEEEKSIIFLLPDGAFMTLTPEQLEKPYSISEPYVNRYADSVGNANCVFKNYVWKEDNRSILASTSSAPANGVWDKLAQVKEKLKEEEKQEIVSEPEIIEPKKEIPVKVKKTKPKGEEEVFQIVKTVTIYGYIGHVVTARRASLNLKDSEVIKRIPGGLSDNTYKDIEEGKETNSKLNTYLGIAKALGLHITDLFPPKN